MPARILLDELLSEEESDQAVNDTEPSVTPASKPGRGAPSREQELLDEVASRDATIAELQRQLGVHAVSNNYKQYCSNVFPYR